MTTTNLLLLLALAPADEKLAAIIDRLRGCRRSNRCNLLCCPRCGPRRKSYEAYKALDRLRRHLCDWPSPEAISWVTLRGPQVDLTSPDIALAWNSFRRKIANVRYRYLVQIAMHGFLDISINGVIHFHGWFHHRLLTRDGLQTLLRRHFGRGKKVHLTALQENQPVAENLETTMRYALERRPRIPEKWGGRQERELPKLVALRLLAFNQVVTRGYVGARMTLGMRRPKEQADGAPLLKLDRAKRKRRRPQTPWFKRNVLRQR